MLPLLPNYYKERFPIQLNWPGAARTLFEGCSLGPPGRISSEFWTPWSGPFREPEQRGSFLKIRDSVAFFRARTCSRMLRSIQYDQERSSRDHEGFSPKESALPFR